VNIGGMSFVLDLNESSDSLYILKKKYIPKQGKTVFIRNAESDDGVFTFKYVGEVITNFEIPISGTYKIEAWGASGGGLNTAPKGAYSKSFVYLNKSERIQILVGEKGYDGYNSGNMIYCAGGGGGSFVAKGETPLCVTGGGGGNGWNSPNSASSYSCGQSGQYGGDPKSRQVELTYGGLGSSNNHGGGGGGFRYNGGNSQGTGKGGISFLNGGWRQNASAYSGRSYGGFGGGGSTHGYCGGSAGGGGYTGGGGGGSDGIQGGGGGSFFTGTYGEANSMAISGCSSLPTKPTSDLNGNVVLTIVSAVSDVNNCKTSSYRCMQISWAIFSTLISS
jgi:hypothetical protein